MDSESRNQSVHQLLPGETAVQVKLTAAAVVKLLHLSKTGETSMSGNL